MPTEGSKGRWIRGFTPLERFLLFAAPLLAGLLTFNHHCRKVDADQRVAETIRQETLVGEVKNLGAHLKVLGDKLAALEKIERDRSIGRDPFQNVAAAYPSRTGLAKWRLGQLRLGFTVIGTTTPPVAVIQDPELRGWPVHVGDSLGGGVVTSIEGDRVLVMDRDTGRTGELAAPRSESYDLTDVPDQYRPAPARYDMRYQPGLPHIGQ
jgi:hypothetical protein